MQIKKYYFGIFLALLTIIPSSAFGATYATWDSGNKGTNLTLSGGDLITTGSGTNWASVLSTVAKSSGKWYWEITMSAGTFAEIGINAGTAELNTYNGFGATGYSYRANNGNKNNNNTETAYGASFTTGDVIGVALDLDGNTVTFYKNNTSQGTAYTGLTGTYYATVSTYDTFSATANFGASAFVYTPPAGYESGLCAESTCSGGGGGGGGEVDRFIF